MSNHYSPYYSTFRLFGVDEGDETALFRCSVCANIIPVELDENGSIDLSGVPEFCPECNCGIISVDLD